ncbi:uncharacterized protein SPPG_00811 [Spizellomyces punctatus DAOM BR117]|uniref:GATA-type domain-containing protein n=1 Tax=Spizellomyces punctatus (strain DAOM BR117) TaxID=645134 RepID=A0A0L0HVN4_SPIPD|nr:uncharacterized protein SPPG_00811 [Spizellomyces punctatus DAOM BR117]KND05142.1 hypothetical protein SPPG_00811 [Spizellomyces punctatus DAOM BR117]|eukprot:XP_016613181.1 hypothetical protein SPPG_00811 [Spizellomyces punctatus DAOM BR117]
MSTSTLKRKRTNTATSPDLLRSVRRSRTISNSPTVTVEHEQAQIDEAQETRFDPFASLLEDISRSRKLWATSMFPPCPYQFPPTPFATDPLIIDEGALVEDIGTGDIVVGPHTFIDTKFYRITPPEKDVKEGEDRGEDHAERIETFLVDMTKDIPIMEHSVDTAISKLGNTVVEGSTISTTSHTNGIVNLSSNGEASASVPSGSQTSSGDADVNRWSLVAKKEATQPGEKMGPVIEPDTTTMVKTETIGGLPETAKIGLAENKDETPPPVSVVPMTTSAHQMVTATEIAPTPRVSVPAINGNAQITVTAPDLFAKSPQMSVTSASNEIRPTIHPPSGLPKPTTAADILRTVNRTGSASQTSTTQSLYANPYFSFPYPFWSSSTDTTSSSATASSPTGSTPKPHSQSFITTSSVRDLQNTSSTSGPPTEWTLQHWSQMNSFLHMVREKRKGDAIPVLPGIASGTSIQSARGGNQSGETSTAMSSKPDVGSANHDGKPGEISQTLNAPPGNSSAATHPAGAPTSWQGTSATTPSSSILATNQRSTAPSGPVQMDLPRVGNHRYKFEWNGPGTPPTEMLQHYLQNVAQRAQNEEKGDPSAKRQKTAHGGSASSLTVPQGSSTDFNVRLVMSTSGNLSVALNADRGFDKATSIQRIQQQAAEKMKAKRPKKLNDVGTEGMFPKEHGGIRIGEKDSITGEIGKAKRHRPRRRVRPLVIFEFVENPGVRFLLPADGMAEVVATTKLSETEEVHELSIAFYLPPYRGGRKQPQQGVVIGVQNTSLRLADCIKEAMYEKAQAVRKLQNKMTHLALPGLTPVHYKDIQKGKELATSIYGPIVDAPKKKPAAPRRRSEAASKTAERAPAKKPQQEDGRLEIENQPEIPNAKSSTLKEEHVDVEHSGELNDVAVNTHMDITHLPLKAVEDTTMDGNQSLQARRPTWMATMHESEAKQVEEDEIGVRGPDAVFTVDQESSGHTKPSVTSTLNTEKELSVGGVLTSASAALTSHLASLDTAEGTNVWREIAASAPNTRAPSRSPSSPGSTPVSRARTPSSGPVHLTDPSTRLSARIATRLQSGPYTDLKHTTSPSKRTPTSSLQTPKPMAGRARKVVSHSAPATPAPSSHPTGGAFRRHAETDHKRRCLRCDSDVTPMWRRGPDGPKTLCNACGVKFMLGKLSKNEQGDWVEGKRRPRE